MIYVRLRVTDLPSDSTTKSVYSYKPAAYLKHSFKEPVYNGTHYLGYDLRTLWILSLDSILRKQPSPKSVKLCIAIQCSYGGNWLGPLGVSTDTRTVYFQQAFAWLPEARIPVFLGLTSTVYTDFFHTQETTSMREKASTLLEYYGGPPSPIPSTDYRKLRLKNNWCVTRETYDNLVLATALDGKEYLVHLERLTAQGPVTISRKRLLELPED